MIRNLFLLTITLILVGIGLYFWQYDGEDILYSYPNRVHYVTYQFRPEDVQVFDGDEGQSLVIRNAFETTFRLPYLQSFSSFALGEPDRIGGVAFYPFTTDEAGAQVLSDWVRFGGQAIPPASCSKVNITVNYSGYFIQTFREAIAAIYCD